MQLFSINSQTVKPILQKKFELEKDLQGLTEQNLQTIFGLQFISSELPINSLRIDTLAFDNETKSFVLIEYKKDRSFSIVDQGFAYLSSMLEHKADFVLEYNEKMGVSLTRNDVDWTQSRVLFLANSFTPHQINAINFKNLPIQLWEVKWFENNSLLFNQLQAKRTNESITSITSDEQVARVTKEVKQNTVDDLFKHDWSSSRELFDLLAERVLKLNSNIVINPTKNYIGFQIEGWNLIVVHVRKTRLVIDLQRTLANELNDPEKKAIYSEKSMQYYNQHISSISLESEDDLDYAMFLIRQVYDKFKETK